MTVKAIVVGTAVEYENFRKMSNINPAEYPRVNSIAQLRGYDTLPCIWISEPQNMSKGAVDLDMIAQMFIYMNTHSIDRIYAYNNYVVDEGFRV